jgi:excisionase family DNA binding protein
MHDIDGPQPLLLTPEQASRMLGMGLTVTYRLIMTKRLRSVQIGRARRITPGALADFVAELEHDGGCDTDL